MADVVVHPSFPDGMTGSTDGEGSPRRDKMSWAVSMLLATLVITASCTVDQTGRVTGIDSRRSNVLRDSLKLSMSKIGKPAPSEINTCYTAVYYGKKNSADPYRYGKVSLDDGRSPAAASAAKTDGSTANDRLRYFRWSFKTKRVTREANCQLDGTQLAAARATKRFGDKRSASSPPAAGGSDNSASSNGEEQWAIEEFDYGTVEPEYWESYADVSSQADMVATDRPLTDDAEVNQLEGRPSWSLNPGATMRRGGTVMFVSKSNSPMFRPAASAPATSLGMGQNWTCVDQEGGAWLECWGEPYGEAICFVNTAYNWYDRWDCDNGCTVVWGEDVSQNGWGVYCDGPGDDGDWPPDPCDDNQELNDAEECVCIDSSLLMPDCEEDDGEEGGTCEDYGTCPPPPTFNLACSAPTVERGSEITCDLIATGTQLTNIAWNFAPAAPYDNLGPVDSLMAGPVDTARWTGKMAAGGTITVTATQFTNPLTAQVLVSDRPAELMGQIDFKIALDSTSINADPPASGFDLGSTAGAALYFGGTPQETITRGPNSKYRFTTQLAYLVYRFNIRWNARVTRPPGGTFFTWHRDKINPTGGAVPSGACPGLTIISQSSGGLRQAIWDHEGTLYQSNSHVHTQRGLILPNMPDIQDEFEGTVSRVALSAEFLFFELTGYTAESLTMADNLHTTHWFPVKDGSGHDCDLISISR